MKKFLLLAILITASTSLALANADQAPANKSAAPDAAWLAQAKAAYPLKTCVVSDEVIGGGMGDGIDYVYKQAGRPDRLVRFCCKDCRKDFDKEPAKYLKLIDEAAAKAKKS
ncbi:MAG: hypothetical protein WCR49_01830 [Opitutae bacterium]